MATVSVALGLVVGVGTAILQQHLGYPWHVLANSASPWLTAMFMAGALSEQPIVGAVSGLVTALCELAGYYATVMVFGWPFLSGKWVLFWFCAGLASGPTFGLAGSRWYWPRRLSAVSAAILPAAWLTEAIVLDSRFGAVGPAEVFGAVAIASMLILGLRHRQYLGVAVGMLAVLPAGVLVELLLTFVYRRLS